MNKSDALTLLGLSEQASHEEVTAAYEKKQSSVTQKLQSAPTEALKQKFVALQQQLEQARVLVLASSADDTTIGQNTIRSSSTSPLTSTKLADLPSMGPTGDAIPLNAGQLLAGRYKVIEQIGAGGMGAVYQATDNNTGRDVALKVLLPNLANNDRARERFLDEARISQQLSHPHIVNVHDVHRDGDLVFLSMELLEGQDLRQLMENRKLARQPFTEKELQHLAGQLCEALAYAHKYTVHRDIKPENVWLTGQGDYKLMDFGIARAQSTTQRTQTGAAMGTAYYMAPEQLRGQTDLDGRADQYAMGVMLYELASEQVPAGLIKPLRQLRKDLSKGFTAAVMRTLNPDPNDRFPDITTFNQSLKKPAAFNLALPWKGLGLAAASLAVVAGVSIGIGSSGINLAALQQLLPASKEEIAAQRASLARIEGEIRVFKQRLDSAQRSLDSDVRDAERNGSSDLAALQHWQRVAKDAVFSSAAIPTLEGELSMADALLRENAFAQARPIYERAHLGYATLLGNFELAGKLYEATKHFEAEQGQWQALKKSWGLHDPAEVTEALELRRQAEQQQRLGELADALASWQQGAESWQGARTAMQGEVERLREAAAAKRRADERARLAALEKQQQDRIALAKAIKERAPEHFRLRILSLNQNLAEVVKTGRSNYSWRQFPEHPQIPATRETASFTGAATTEVAYSGEGFSYSANVVVRLGCLTNAGAAAQRDYSGSAQDVISYSYYAAPPQSLAFPFSVEVTAQGVKYILQADTEWPSKLTYNAHKQSRSCTNMMNSFQARAQAHNKAWSQVRPSLTGGIKKHAETIAGYEILVPFSDRERAIYESDPEKFKALLK